MKIYKILNYFFLVLLFFCFGCTEDKKFSGSPVDTLEMITLQGLITTSAASTLTDQEIDVTVSLPNNKVFSDVVTVEVSSFAISGVRKFTTIDIPPNQSSATGKLEVIGGSIFSSSLSLKLTAIKLKSPELGKHYLITSPSVTLPTSNVIVPAVNPDACIVRLVWPFPDSKKNLRFFVDKPAPLADISVNSLNSYGKQHVINNEGTTNDLNTSSANGEYIFKTSAISAAALLIQPVDVPYKVVVLFPDGVLKVFEGEYQGLVTTSPLKSLVKITKSTSIDGVVSYTATDQF
jgi:hypothetical protein